MDPVIETSQQVMLDLYLHYLNVVRTTFKDDGRFMKSFKQACENFINYLPHISESLAIHAHYFLDKTCPESKYEQVEVALDQIILLFNFIHDKDLFHRCYAKLLAHRIVNVTSVSDEAEQRMWRHVRTVCGFQYAMTLRRMYMDKTLSTQLTGEFKKYLDPNERYMIQKEESEEDGALNKSSGREHVRRKSDSAIDFVEMENGRVSPRPGSPHNFHRAITIHDNSPLQKILSKRVFADKIKRYREAPATTRTPTRTRVFFGAEDPFAELPMDEILTSVNDTEEEKPKVELFVFVLTGGSWPYQPLECPVHIPHSMTLCVEKFSEFYKYKFNNRRLVWLHDLAHGEMLASCFDRPYTLILSAFQMAILDLYNTATVIRLDAMRRELQMEGTTLIKCLYPLIHEKILIANPPVMIQSQLTPQHEIALNPSFTSTRKVSRIQIPARVEDSGPGGAAVAAAILPPGQVSPALLNERKGMVEARIVWLMKQNSAMRHEDIITGVVQHAKTLNFLPPRDFIEEIIKSDVDKDFFEIEEYGTNPLYRYQA